MPSISTKDRYLTVLNVFFTDSREKQDRLLKEMRSIVDTAAYPGWISSTVHSGQDQAGTLNFIQWRSSEDLQARYAGEKFKHRTVPLFSELSTSMMLLQNEVVHTQSRRSGSEVIDISPDRDDYTVFEFYGVPQSGQADLVEALGPSRNWLLDVPGYRAHIVLRGVGARGFDGAFVISYSQWDSKEAYDAFRNQPEAEQPEARRKTQARIDSLATDYQSNTLRVVHTRSAGQ